MDFSRRKFISTGFKLSSLAAISACHPYKEIVKNNKFNFKNLDKPLAINMWDFTWLLRTYPGGGFEDFDRVLDDLLIRGYDALRIDCFPQFIAKNDSGIIKEKYLIPANNWKTLWGNNDEVEIKPHESLELFMKKCNQRNIKIALSSWFSSHGTNRNKEFSGVKGLVRAWNETLDFLSKKNLLDNVIYVDILNEYPLWHGFSWLHKELDKLKSFPKTKPWDFLNEKGRKNFNSTQITFYNNFLNDSLSQLKANWPHINFMVSQTNTLNVPWADLDVRQNDVLDIHLWYIYNYEMSKSTSYFSDLHTKKSKNHIYASANKVNSYWKENKAELNQWLFDNVAQRSQLAKKLNIPLGNTEGWGPVVWFEDENLDWTFVKEAGIHGAKTGSHFNFAFNCSSNFNHPHFKTLWNDIAWHKEVTSIIKNT